jgi:two-component system response regulator LytT
LGVSGEIKVLIVEDELIIAEDIRSKLSGLGYKVTGIATDVKEAESFLQNGNPDIVMLDIILRDGDDGIALAEIIRNQYDIPFVFLTSHADKATIERAKRVKPDGYLVKPFTDRDLYSSIEIAFFKKTDSRVAQEGSSFEHDNTVLNDSIIIKKDYLLIKIKFVDLQWIMSDGNYLKLHCSDDKKYLVRSTLKDLLARFPKGLFLQTHKSYAVNTEHILAVEYEYIVIGKHHVPVGRLFMQNVRNTMHKNIR